MNASKVDKSILQYLYRIEHGVTIIEGFPYLLAEMNKLDYIPKSIKFIISGGDVIRTSYITRLKDLGIKIYNTYGPSETSVCSNYFRVDNAKPLADGTFPDGIARLEKAFVTIAKINQADEAISLRLLG